MTNLCKAPAAKLAEKNPEYRRKIYGQKTSQGPSTDGDTACFSIG